MLEVPEKKFTTKKIKKKALKNISQREDGYYILSSDTEDILGRLKLSKVSKIWIKDITIYNTEALSCEDIILENCKILSLSLIGCRNILIKDSRIGDIRMRFSGECTFENNKIPWVLHNKLEEDEFNKKGTSELFALVIIVLLPLVVIYSVGGFNLIPYIFVNAYVSNDFVYYLMSVGIILGVFIFLIIIYFIFNIFKMKIRAKGFQKNEYIDNVIIEKSKIVNDVENFYQINKSR